MSGSLKSEQLRLGFLETMEVEGRGHVGGLLVTNQHGRPLEFQCTTPVKPNRTQEILYGETLKPWLLGELIGGTLLERVSIKPDIIVISDPNILELRNHTSIPVACTSDLPQSATATAGTSPVGSVSIGTQRLRFHDAHHNDADTIAGKRHLIPDQADLAEPLERVREALAETVKTVLAR